MALLKKIKNSNYHLAIWQLAESDEELRQILDNSAILQEIEQSVKAESRVREKIATHILVREIMGESLKIEHKKNGAPYIPGRDTHISISHNRNLVAVITSNHPVGIDIEERKRKQYSLHGKFTTPTEKKWIDGTQSESEKQLICEVLWSAKEALYKLADTPGLKFESEIEIEPFDINSASEFTFNASCRNIPCLCHATVSDSEVIVIAQIEAKRNY